MATPEESAAWKFQREQCMSEINAAARATDAVSKVERGESLSTEEVELLRIAAEVWGKQALEALRNHLDTNPNPRPIADEAMEAGTAPLWRRAVN